MVGKLIFYPINSTLVATNILQLLVAIYRYITAPVLKILHGANITYFSIFAQYLPIFVYKVQPVSLPQTST